jgi:hypothetical protein
VHFSYFGGVWLCKIDGLAVMLPKRKRKIKKMYFIHIVSEISQEIFI